MITTKIQVLFFTFLLGMSHTPSYGSALRPVDQQTGPDVSQEKVLDIIKRAKTPTADVYTPAFEELKKVGPDRLIELSRSTEVEVRAAAAEGLGIIGPMNARVIPTLIALATEGDQKVRLVAIRALGAAGYRAEVGEAEINAVLVRLLSDADPELRAEACQAVEHLALNSNGQGFKWAMPALVSRLGDEDTWVRTVAARALGTTGPQGPDVIPALSRLMSDPEARVRAAAVEALGKCGENLRNFDAERGRSRAADLIPLLKKAMADPDKEIRYEVAAALGAIGPVTTQVMSLLVKLTRDRSAGVRQGAVGSIGSFHPHTRGVVPALISALKDSDSGVVYTAVNDLGNHLPEARTAIPALRPLLQHKDERVREITRDVLANMLATP
jgi:HEAT repeat protein